MGREFRRRLAAQSLLACMLWAPALVVAQVTPPPPAAGLGAEDPGRTQRDASFRERSPLASDPKTPEDLLEATQLMVDIARPDLAKVYFDKLLTFDLDDAALLALRDRFGAGTLLRLAAVPELADGARKLIDRSNTAAMKRANDPARVSDLLRRLEGPREQQAVAEVELQSLGVHAVPTLLQILADDMLKDLHENAMVNLVRAGDPAVPMLVAALDASSPMFRANVITVLGHIRSQRAAPYLWYSATSGNEQPSVRSAARQALGRIYNTNEAGVERLAGQGMAAKLLKLAREHYRREVPWPDANGDVTVWTWRDDTRTVEPRHVSTVQASDAAGLIFARQALALAPERADVQTLYLSLALAADLDREGIHKPLPTGPGTAHDLALSVGADVVAQVLSEALASGRASTAIAALKVLEQVGTTSQVVGPAGKKPMVAALDYPDPAVQFAAASAILQLDPQQSFRGSTRVVEVLKRAVGASGKPHAVVGEIVPERGAQIGGFLRELGFEPVVCLTGRDAFEAAASRADVGLIVLHPGIIRWALTDTLANLRADSRTAGIPIVLHSPERVLSKLNAQTRNFRQVSLITLAQSTEDFELQLKAMLAQARTPVQTPEQQAAQRVAALGWLAHIAQGRRTKIFDLSGSESVLSEALLDAQLAPTALETLGELASREAQARIADVALDPQAAADLRAQAALKLSFHIQRFGLLLPNAKIEALHEVWRDGGTPAELRTALGGTIGSLKPNATLVGKRLREFPAAPAQ